MDTMQSVFDFLNAGVSPWHAAAAAAAQLDAAGYTRLDETSSWSLEPEGKYYVTRNGSAVLAFRIPAKPIQGWRIALAHGDNPTWRIKNADVQKAGYCKLETEGYGSMIMSTWLDRPLTVAGRAMVKTAQGMESRLVYIDRDLLTIPNVAIHFDRSVNDGRKWDPQVDMQPLFGPAGCRSLKELVAQAAGVAPEDLLTWDLCLVTRQKATCIGPDGEYFMSPRIDDLECASTTLLAFLASQAPEGIAPVWGLLDNEEVGSSSRQGAQGTFLADVLDRILAALAQDVQARWRLSANSLIVSADNGHAIHPNHPEKSDPENAPALNGGVVLKMNASQKYTTDAVSGALFESICRQIGVPTQRLANRADIPGGSTLGNLQGHSIGAPMLDIGLAQLAMHSAVETAGVQDIQYMVQAVTAFYGASIRCVADGRYQLD